jgi:hypothetical protein
LLVSFAWLESPDHAILMKGREPRLSENSRWLKYKPRSSQNCWLPAKVWQATSMQDWVWNARPNNRGRSRFERRGLREMQCVLFNNNKNDSIRDSFECLSIANQIVLMAQ